MSNRTSEPEPLGRFVPVSVKMGIAILIVLAAVMVAVYVSLSRMEREKMLRAKEEGARMVEQLFVRSVAVQVVFDDETGVQESAHKLATDAEVLAVDVWSAKPNRTFGKLLAKDHKPGNNLELEPRFVSSLVVERRDDRIIMRDAILSPEATIVGIAIVQFSLERENHAYAELQQFIIRAAAGVSLLVAFLLWAITRRTILAPLSRLLSAIRQMETGERVDVAMGIAHDEIGNLANAFERMADAVEGRERDIARRNHDMKLVLDNVGEGFLVVDSEGRIAREHSAILSRWFGMLTPGQLIGDYFSHVDANMAAMLAMGIEAIHEGFMPLEVLIEQLPKSITQADRRYACEYHPVMRGETVEQLVIVIADVTVEFERARAERSQRDLIAAVSHLIADRSGFIDFLHEAGGLIGRIVYADAVDVDDVDKVAVMRDLHTLKGITAIFGISSVSEYCHTLEDQAKDLGDLPTQEARLVLGRMWEALRQQLAPFRGSSKAFIELSREEYNSLAMALQTRASHARLLAMLEHLSQEPVRPRLERLGEHAISLVKRLGKCDLKLDLDGTTLRLPHEPWSRLWPTLVHLVRNSVDHGLETTGERIAAGKSAAARLTLSAHQHNGIMTLVIADDGRGIDWERLRTKAATAGLRVETQEDLVAALFADGVSTRTEVSDTSGRGIGLAAVREVVTSLGGAIRVTSTLGVGTRFQIEIPNAVAAELASDHRAS